jgi:hypothetical protein
LKSKTFSDPLITSGKPPEGVFSLKSIRLADTHKQTKRIDKIIDKRNTTMAGVCCVVPKTSHTTTHTHTILNIYSLWVSSLSLLAFCFLFFSRLLVFVWLARHAPNQNNTKPQPFTFFGFIFIFSDGAKANHKKKKKESRAELQQPNPLPPHPKSIYWKMDQFVIRLISN